MKKTDDSSDGGRGDGGRDGMWAEEPPRMKMTTEIPAWASRRPTSMETRYRRADRLRWCA